MEWNEKLQEIVDYVELNLQKKEEPIDIKYIAEIAGCSYPFFQKVFSYLNKVSFAEYVRYRKLTLAGYDLKSTTIKIVDLSYKYGYDSPTSFTKAFQQFHGVSPTKARNGNYKLNIFPKLQTPEKQEYSWKIEYKSSIRLIGKSVKLSCKDNRHYMGIPAFWSECQQNGTFTKLISMDTNNIKGLYGLSGFYDEISNEIEYSIMVSSDCDLPSDFTEITIPETTWAVFDCKGMIPQAIQNTWKYLNQEWIVKYPFKHADCPEIEWFSNGNTYDENYLSQIWIPIIEEA